MATLELFGLLTTETTLASSWADWPSQGRKVGPLDPARSLLQAEYFEDVVLLFCREGEVPGGRGGEGERASGGCMEAGAHSARGRLPCGSAAGREEPAMPGRRCSADGETGPRGRTDLISLVFCRLSANVVD